MSDENINRPPRHTTPVKQWLLKVGAQAVLRTVASVDLQGMENVLDGALVLTLNHLSSFDTLAAVALAPIRQGTAFAAVEHRSDFIVGWLFDQMGVIWVRRGEADREAIKIALAELKSGTALGMAIEGTRSRTGGLQAGRTGPAFIATRAGVPILPAAVWGTEKIIANVKRLKRSEVHIRVGQPFHLPPGRASTEQLEQYTEQIMLRIAAMLPPDYRGVYRERLNALREAEG